MQFVKEITKPTKRFKNIPHFAALKRKREWKFIYKPYAEAEIKIVRLTAAPIFQSKVVVNGRIYSGDLWKSFWAAVLEAWTVASNLEIVDGPTKKEEKKLNRRIQLEMSFRNFFGMTVGEAKLITKDDLKTSNRRKEKK